MNLLRYTLLSGVVIAGTAMGQWATPRAAQMQLEPTSTSQLPLLPAAEPANSERAGGDVVWSEDFANGLAGNNGIGAWTTSGPNGNIWKRAVSGPVGGYTVAAARIQSLTVSNGYMLFNSDSANSTWVGNTPTPLPESSFTNWEGSLESPVLDLSATPYVELVFQQRLRYCCGDSPHLLEVSTDGGATWPTSFNVAENWTANEQTLSNTETYRLNLVAAISADPSNVRLRFRHSAEAGTSHYHWQIDDVSIVELYEFDLRMTNADITNWDDLAATSYDSLNYTIFPVSQLRTMGLNANVMNNGALQEDNMVVNFIVTGPGGAVALDQDQAQDPLAPGEERKVFVNPSFTPPAVEGLYQVEFNASGSQTDETPADNSATKSFRVSQNLYARDNGTVASVQNSGGNTLIMCNAFYIKNEGLLYGISVALGTGSEIGALVQGELRADNLEDVIATTEEVFITASMLTPVGGSQFLNLVFNPPVQLSAGMDYMAAVQVFGDIRIGRSGVSAPQTSFLYFDGQNGLDWYYTTTTPMIRMNFDPTVGIDALDVTNTLGLGQNIPNPAHNSTAIPYQLEKAGAVSFRMHDVTGKLVMEENLGNRAPGVYRFEMNTENLREGVYFYTMTVGDASASKRMVVVR